LGVDKLNKHVCAWHRERISEYNKAWLPNQGTLDSYQYFLQALCLISLSLLLLKNKQSARRQLFQAQEVLSLLAFLVYSTNTDAALQVRGIRTYMQ
jgi:hypothetical protein